MTDDEIDAALRPSLAIQWACDEDMVRVPNSARLAYRAGMLRAAQIARSQATAAPFDQWEYAINIGYRDAAREIERAAADEQTGGRSMSSLPWSPEETARRLHNACEALAPMFGYATRDVPLPWAELPDRLRAVLIAAVRAVLIEQANDASDEPPA